MTLTLASLSRKSRTARFSSILLPGLSFLILSLLVLPAYASETPGDGTRYVVLISVDGLRPDAITRHSQAQLPNFYRFRTEGAFTDNARTDADITVTLPNHIAQLTGRRVMGPAGHNWIANRTPEEGETIHSNNGGYVASVFDVLQDHGLRAGAYASKSKFMLLDRSYSDATADADDRPLDRYVYEKRTSRLVSQFLSDMKADPVEFSFLHLRDPDTFGHVFGWSLWRFGPYMHSVRKVDRLLGEVFNMVESHPQMAGNTVIILTADHGGSGRHHGDHAEETHYTIPFYVWGNGIPNADLYALNVDTRRDPGSNHPGYDVALQPIRNGGAANLALSLLGMSEVPGSSINTTQKLRVFPIPMITHGISVSGVPENSVAGVQ
jgi:hypothetical protein